VNHPETLNRIANVKREIGRLGPARPEAIIDSPAFQKVKTILLNPL
jgi:hypothetical protein